MTPKQWQKFLETGEARHFSLMYYPWPDPTMPKGRWWSFHWTGCDGDHKLRDAGMLCRTREEADELAGVMLAAAKEWRKKR